MIVAGRCWLMRCAVLVVVTFGGAASAAIADETPFRDARVAREARDGEAALLRELEKLMRDVAAAKDGDRFSDAMAASARMIAVAEQLFGQDSWFLAELREQHLGVVWLSRARRDDRELVFQLRFLLQVSRDLLDAGEYPQAASSSAAVAATYEQLGVSFALEQANALTQLGAARLASGEPRAAEQNFSRALQIYDDRSLKFSACEARAGVFVARSLQGKAIDPDQARLRIVSGVADELSPEGVSAHVGIHLARLYDACGQARRADELYEQARRAINDDPQHDPLDRARVLLAWSESLLARGEKRLAAESLKEAFRITIKERTVDSLPLLYRVCRISRAAIDPGPTAIEADDPRQPSLGDEEMLTSLVLNALLDGSAAAADVRDYVVAARAAHVACCIASRQLPAGDPYRYMALSRLAASYRDLGWYASCVETCEHALASLDQHDEAPFAGQARAMIWITLGTGLESSARFEAARKHYRNALDAYMQVEPMWDDNSVAIAAAIGGLLAASEPVRAEEILKDVIDAAPRVNDSEESLCRSYIALATSHRVRGQLEDAERLLQRAGPLTLEPNVRERTRAMYYRELGELKRTQGHLREAAVYLGKAVANLEKTRAAPNSLDIACVETLADVLRADGREEEANERTAFAAELRECVRSTKFVRIPLP